MTEQQIIEALNQLAEIQAQADLLRLNRDAALEAATPVEVRQALADIEAEYEPMLEAAAAKANELTAAIKAAVTQHGASVKGSRAKAVFTKGRVTWNTDALDGYVVDHPELLAFRKPGKPSVSIR